MKPTSPMRVTRNALRAAAAADGFSIPEADQQVAAQADAFPEGEQQQEVVGQHQPGHREDEQRRPRRRSADSRGRRACSRRSRWRSSVPMNVTVDQHDGRQRDRPATRSRISTSPAGNQV